jgi:hypothetical protein
MVVRIVATRSTRVTGKEAYLSIADPRRRLPSLFVGEPVQDSASIWTQSAEQDHVLRSSNNVRRVDLHATDVAYDSCDTDARGSAAAHLPTFV